MNAVWVGCHLNFKRKMLEIVSFGKTRQYVQRSSEKFYKTNMFYMNIMEQNKGEIRNRFKNFLIRVGSFNEEEAIQIVNQTFEKIAEMFS